MKNMLFQTQQNYYSDFISQLDFIINHFVYKSHSKFRVQTLCYIMNYEMFLVAADIDTMALCFISCT